MGSKEKPWTWQWFREQSQSATTPEAAALWAIATILDDHLKWERQRREKADAGY